MPNQFQGDTDSGTAGRELVQHVIRLMLASSCFGREVCPTPPCACAQSLIDAITAARIPALLTVWVVHCIEDDGDTTAHIFSTQERAQAFMDTDQRPHVLSDYVVDHPERKESVQQ